MSVYCQDCDKELSEERGEYAHGCLDCHGAIPSEKLFWLRKELASLKEELKEARKAIKTASTQPYVGMVWLSEFLKKYPEREG